MSLETPSIMVKGNWYNSPHYWRNKSQEGKRPSIPPDSKKNILMSKYFNGTTVTCDFTAFWNFSICFGKAQSIMLFEVWLQKYIFYNYLLVTQCIQYIVPGLLNYFPAQNLSTFRNSKSNLAHKQITKTRTFCVYYEVNVSHVTDGFLFSLGTKSWRQKRIICKEWQ